MADNGVYEQQENSSWNARFRKSCSINLWHCHYPVEGVESHCEPELLQGFLIGNFVCEEPHWNEGRIWSKCQFIQLSKSRQLERNGIRQSHHKQPIWSTHGYNSRQWTRSWYSGPKFMKLLHQTHFFPNLKWIKFYSPIKI